MKTEVGIFNLEKSAQSEQLSLGGFLITIGDETKLSESSKPVGRIDRSLNRQSPHFSRSLPVIILSLQI